MLKKYCYLLCAILLLSSAAVAQDVQWASKVIDKSSEYSPAEYSAEQVLGKPNVYPSGGDNPNAWIPAKDNKKDFVKVGFATPKKIQQIIIVETYNPSAVYQVFTYDKDGKETLVNTFEPEGVTRRSRLLNVFFNMTEYEVAAVKVVIDGSKVEGYNGLDAIGISPSKTPVTFGISVSDSINSDVKVERLSPNVNSKFKEIGPLISPDGSTLFFSRRNHPDNIGGVKDMEDIWYSVKDPSTGDWSEAQNIGAPLNNEGPNFINSITPDGESMLLVLGNQYKKNGKMRAGISISRKVGDGWSQPENVEIEDDYNINEKANYFLANNRKVLLMSVEREDTRGSRDLYVSFSVEDEDNEGGFSKWTAPLNMGDDLNTAGEDASPFLAADDRTLYFSSNGYSGFGGSDIYVSRRLDDTWTNWSEPENLGSAINSEDDDTFFNIPPDGEFAYYSRGVGTDDADLFRIPLPSFYKPAPVIRVSGTVYNSVTKQPVGAKIIYERLPDGKNIGMTQSDPASGKYNVILPSGDNYGYMAQAEGYLAVNENIDLTRLSEYDEIERDLYLVPAGKGQDVKLTLNNIFFDFDKSELKPESFPELNRLIEFLKRKENVEGKITIAGYTDAVGSKEYNINLSRRRAQSVADYLTKNGIAKSLIKVEAHGESNPDATNETAEGRQKNRRVEFFLDN